MSHRRIALACLIVLGGIALVSTRAQSQDEQADQPARKKKKAVEGQGAGAMGGMPSPEQMAEMMKKCAAACKPGEHHKMLEHFIGSWDAVSRMWMDPGAPPVETKGRSNVKWMLDGRFTMDEYSGEIMMPNEKGELSAQPFKGIGITGFDNVKNIYVGSWLDSMGTGILTMSGGYNPTTKTLLMFGKMDDIAMGVYDKTLRYETKIVDQDKHVFTMYDCHAGIDYKVMEITYTRAK